uniref:Uncharacterized protein n=1 Tax=Nelumbo nucifera TaxID=4432 RepID=A0A822XCC3_NELNU|nr:TPA_asm: hypothetical protein HUJ06_020527 [Nelumbo nucifera]
MSGRSIQLSLDPYASSFYSSPQEVCIREDDDEVELQVARKRLIDVMRLGVGQGLTHSI